MNITIRILQAFLLVVWLGGMIFFSFILAPSAFQALPTQKLAGEVVSVSIQKLNLISHPLLIVFLILVILFPATPKGQKAFSQRLLLVLVALALIFSLYADFRVNRRLHVLRAKLADTDVAETPSLEKVEFDRLHKRSVQLMGTNMVFGLLILGTWIRQVRNEK